ncbi:MAG TPA: nucleotidyl transferase AbiEii/AbiGii toxin family protein, partial [bacterium]|nr:nucleotidyl transferase AbiEii/AbiGii toxin family protein [bacterium]
MKEYVQEGISRLADPQTARSWVREYLQARILESLQAAGAMAAIAFHGGTCLRFLYSTPRYSEDLDFALERPSVPHDFGEWVRRTERDFAAEGYTVDSQVRNDRPVHSAFIRFPGLLFELGLSAQRTEALAVKLEVDTQPPA